MPVLPVASSGSNEAALAYALALKIAGLRGEQVASI